MRRLHRGFLILIPVCLSLYLGSCTAGSCFDETEAKVKGTFYSTETGKPLVPDSVTLFGIGMDTLKLYDKTLNLKTAEFPLFADATDRKFVIRVNGINDTMEFRYSSYTYLLSKECGFTFYFNLDTVIHTLNIIQSVSIEKNTITTFNEENMRIFF
jgi:hypothetical protein